jgi:hypothetical protein
VGFGSVLTAEILGCREWEIVELRHDSGPLISAKDADGTVLRIGGTLVCRGVAPH